MNSLHDPDSAQKRSDSTTDNGEPAGNSSLAVAEAHETKRENRSHTTGPSDVNEKSLPENPLRRSYCSKNLPASTRDRMKPLPPDHCAMLEIDDNEIVDALRSTNTVPYLRKQNLGLPLTVECRRIHRSDGRPLNGQASAIQRDFQEALPPILSHVQPRTGAKRIKCLDPPLVSQEQGPPPEHPNAVSNGLDGTVMRHSCPNPHSNRQGLHVLFSCQSR